KSASAADDDLPRVAVSHRIPAGPARQGGRCSPPCPWRPTQSVRISCCFARAASARDMRDRSPLCFQEFVSMVASKRIARGFTLVEILIVVVILGILAAIVIPQFTSASESAKGSNLLSQLQTIRSQLELYQVQHNGSYPTLAQLGTTWDVMVNKTDVTGTDM